MTTINERVAAVEVYTDGHAKEIESLRHSRHEHSNMLHNHDGKLTNHENIINNISLSVDKLAKIADRFMWVSSGGIAVGAFLIGLIIYTLKEIFKVW